MRGEMVVPPGVSAAFVALVVGLYALLVALPAVAQLRAGAAGARVRRAALVVALPLAGWLALTGVLAARGAFADFTGLPPRIALAIVPPLVAVVAVTVLAPPLSTVPAVWLVAPQAFRIVMELILWRLAIHGAVSEIMTFHGRNFDVLTGLTAPLVAWAMAHGRIGPRGILLWNFAGLALVTNVFVHGLLSVPTRFRVLFTDPPNTVVAGFPFVWLVAFVVPVAYLLHALSLRRTLTHWS
jgi:hypothetical protein